jgi:hypothetical protein
MQVAEAISYTKNHGSEECCSGGVVKSAEKEKSAIFGKQKGLKRIHSA